MKGEQKWSEQWTLRASKAGCVLPSVRRGPAIYHEQEVEVVPKLEAEQAIQTERERVGELEAKLADAAEMVLDWGAYASDYFQEKWDLEADIQTLLQAALAVAEGDSDEEASGG